MASAGGVGIDIDVARVPLREADMEPFEIMVSESQERMLAVVEPARVAEVLAVCESWQTGAAEIGEVTDGGMVRVLRGEELAGEMPVEALVDGCPLYDLEPAAPEGWIYGNRATLDRGRRAPRRRCWRCSPRRASPRSAGPSSSTTRSSARAPCAGPRAADAAVLAIPEADTAIAVSIDGNGRRVACDPYAGTVEAVLECAQNLACAGAEPLGLTNCLNFGNPEKPAPPGSSTARCSGLADACEALGVPVVGGNVSLYNEGPEGPIYPTPVVGMVGELPDPGARRAERLRRRGRRDRLLGPFEPSLAGSELAKLRGELGPGLPQPDVAAVAAACAAVRDAARGRARSPPPTTSATAASPARSPSARSAPGSAAGSTSSTCASAAARRRRRCSARAPAASSSAASARASRRWPATASPSSLGQVGGERDRDRRRRPQPRRRARRRRARLALAGRAGGGGQLTAGLTSCPLPDAQYLG